jgi:hypothetical protein
MAIIESIELELDSLYHDFYSFFGSIESSSHLFGKICRELLALIKSAYYEESCLTVDWDLLQRYWNFNSRLSFPPPLSDAEFSSLQCAFLVMLSIGDAFASQFIRHYPKYLSQEWLIQGGWSKVLTVFLISFPLMIISIYPKICDLPFCAEPESFDWVLLLQYGRIAPVNMLDVVIEMCNASEVPTVLESPDDRSSFDYIQKLVNFHIGTYLS